MYERFTDRARKVMQFANQEAQRFYHEYIGTEHILLGIVKEGAGVAAMVLKNLGVDLRKIRLDVEKLIQPGPEYVTMGKLPQTPRAKKVIEFAILESQAMRHNHIGTEHLLLGLIREGEGVASQVLMHAGVDLTHVQYEIDNLLGTGNRDDADAVPRAHEVGPVQPCPSRVIPETVAQGSTFMVFRNMEPSPVQYHGLYMRTEHGELQIIGANDELLTVFPSGKWDGAFKKPVQ